MPTVAVTLAKSCCRCRVKLEKILCIIQEGCGFVFDKVEYDKDGKVMITGTFDAIDLCCKIKCKARCFVTKVEIVPPKKEEPKKKDDEKKPETKVIPCPYPYPYPYPCLQPQPCPSTTTTCPTPPPDTSCSCGFCKPKPVCPPKICCPPPPVVCPPPPPTWCPPPPPPCPYPPTCRPPACGYPRDCYQEPDGTCTVM
ncbi:hypothetical protein HU200_027091 [Digitaria exilis]|uniref:Uncharacterized protein n=1 Tax=Digitaria exilis TaxID=1010633 RepID=A0A835ER80_9POAL|nr:hypothetical protein HU200_027091 [Digitaria exilis]CAB3486925.1 unnamed protein product [Digitaria exilis]